MKILSYIHLYPPRHNAGAETYIHTLHLEAMRRGHQVKVLNMDAKKYGIRAMYDHQGVGVFLPDVRDYLLRWCDVIITHLDYSREATFAGKEYGKPVIHIAHNDIPYPSVLQAECRLKVIYNAQWVADKLAYKWPGMVFPPVPNDGAKVKEWGQQEYVMMVNLNENKGAPYFYSVARKLPQYKFMAVRGSYDKQILPDPKYKNIVVVPNTPDIARYFATAKVVLMLSHYESWGLVATEAIMNGLPVIANPTPGLQENLGDAGIFIPRKKTADIAAMVDKLMTDGKFYAAQVRKAKKRSAELLPDWDKLFSFIQA